MTSVEIKRIFSISRDADDLYILRGFNGTNQTLLGLVFHHHPLLLCV